MQIDWNNLLKNWLIPKPAKPSVGPALEPGIYHFQREREGQYVRFHLRVDPGGRAILIAAAAEAVRLSPAGAVAAKGLLSGKSCDQVADELSNTNAFDLVQKVKQAIDDIGQPNFRYPIFNLTDQSVDGPSLPLLAPFQADNVPGDKESQFQILDQLWKAGVPHARLVCENEVDVNLLAAVIQHAEDIGMITGLRARASALMTGELIKKLAQVGLDYVVIPWAIREPAHTQIYGPNDFDHVAQAIQAARAREMTAVVEAPLVQENVDCLDDELEQLIAWGVTNVEVFAVARREDAPSESSEDDLHAIPGNELRQLAAWIDDLSGEHPLDIAWLPPVDCPSSQSVSSTASRVSRASGEVSIRVEADGTVVPPRGPFRAAGNILNQSWSQIWNHEVLGRFRGEKDMNIGCGKCPGLAVCSSYCPADPEGWVSGSRYSEY